MSLPSVSAVTEALGEEHIEFTLEGEFAILHHTHHEAIWEAARFYPETYQDCDTCDGAGEYYNNPTGRSTFNHMRKCPDCEGRGKVPREEAVEALTHATITYYGAGAVLLDEAAEAALFALYDLVNGNLEKPTGSRLL